jgi:deaminated glutathione amidase
MRIALGQLGAGADKRQNLERIAGFTAQAARGGAELVVFPEAAMAGGEPGGDLTQFAEPLDGPFVGGLREAARRNGIALVAGVFEPGSPERVYNTVVAIRPDGELFGSYRKIHLYDAFGGRESDRIQPGDGRTMVFEHAGISFGVMTCYELRFPEMGRQLVEQGAQVLLLPAAWQRGPLKELHWETLARARAIENTVYVAASGQVSERSIGLSAIFDPMGVAIVSAGEVEGVVTGDVSLERLAEVRRTNPSLAMRRPDVYAAWQPVRR